MDGRSCVGLKITRKITIEANDAEEAMEKAEEFFKMLDSMEITIEEE